VPVIYESEKISARQLTTDFGVEADWRTPFAAQAIS